MRDCALAGVPHGAAARSPRKGGRGGWVLLCRRQATMARPTRGARPRDGGAAAPAALAALLCALALAAGRAAGDPVDDGQKMVDADEHARMYHERYGNEWPFDSPYNYWDPREIARREAEVFAIDKKRDRLDKWMMFVQELMTPNVCACVRPRALPCRLCCACACVSRGARRPWSELTNPWVRRLRGVHYLPQFTHHGVQVEELPTQVKTRLYDFLHDNMDNIKLEPAKKNKKMCYPTESGEEVHPGFVQLPKALKDDVAAALKPIHERWCNCKLKYSAFYGIRLYYNGCALRCHVDRIETHVVSSVIHIADDVQESWPIEIKDHYGRFHSANLAAGEMLHYESAKLLHCRSTVLRGSVRARACWRVCDLCLPPCSCASLHRLVVRADAAHVFHHTWMSPHVLTAVVRERLHPLCTC